MNASRFARYLLVLVSVLAVLSFLGLSQGRPAGAATSALDFRNTMRKLWEDHITWTRLYIVSAAANLPDKDLTAKRLLANQEDIGNAVKAYYGEDAGNKLTALLKDHILGAAALLTAAQSGDAAQVDAASKKWYANADEISAFLNSANPQAFPLEATRSEMKMHLDLTLQEAVDRLQGKYEQDIQDYDHVHAHILGLADTLSNGIISQFPDKFPAQSTGTAGQSAQKTLPTSGSDHVHAENDNLFTALLLGVLLSVSGAIILQKTLARK